MNLIVVVEGCDAAGKHTQTEMLAQKLGGTVFSFPNYESVTGKAIREHLQRKWACAEFSGATFEDPHKSEAHLVKEQDEALVRTHLRDSMVFQSLQTVNRIELLPAIREARGKGAVIFDRYWASAVIYGGLDGLDTEWLLTTQAAPMPKPDIWILLDIPVEESFKRRPERRDRYETDRPYLERIRAAYRYFFEKKQSLEKWPEWHIVDAMGTVAEVHQKIVDITGEFQRKHR